MTHDHDFSALPEACAAPVPGTPMLGRRRVLQAAAWSVPAVTVASAAPAFATSGEALQALSFTSGAFWRPLSAEANSFGEGFYWSLVPETTIMWITALTNNGASALSNVQLALSVPLGTAAKRDFMVLDAGGTTTVPALNALTNRSASGVGITVPQLPANSTTTLTVAIAAPSDLRRGTAAAWPLTVTPPAAGTTTSVPITTYTAFRNSVG